MSGLCQQACGVLCLHSVPGVPSDAGDGAAGLWRLHRSIKANPYNKACTKGRLLHAVDGNKPDLLQNQSVSSIQWVLWTAPAFPNQHCLSPAHPPRPTSPRLVWVWIPSRSKLASHTEYLALEHVLYSL